MLSANGIAFICYIGGVALGLRRSRMFGCFLAVVLVLPILGGNVLRPALKEIGAAVLVGQLACSLHFASLAVLPRMRPLWWRALVSIPGLFWSASCLMAWPWMVAALLGWPLPGVWLPFLLAAFGVVQTLRGKEEEVCLNLRSAAHVGVLKRCLAGNSEEAFSLEDGLKLVQITDPHLGPFMSVNRLKAICQRAVERQPDVVVITGDLMTMESQDIEVVHNALSPLAQLQGKVFACHGNHDLEARDVVRKTYERLGIRLLIDEAATLSTRVGDVEIVGADFKWKQRKQHLQELLQKFPRQEGHCRLLLLHDPGAFRHLPEGAADLVLSGHTHGGQLGLLSLGFNATVMSLLSNVPDHGLWGLGKNRLYVHRAQGVYGFPLRIGVPSEQSLMSIKF